MWFLKIIFNLIGIYLIYKGYKFSRIDHKENKGNPLDRLFDGNLVLGLISALFFRLLPWWVNKILIIALGCLLIFLAFYIQVK